MMLLTQMHLLGLSLGFGVAIALDLILLKKIVSNDVFGGNDYRMIFQLSLVVAFGLCMLWISGIGFLWQYLQTEPQKLYNPKIWAKLCFVILVSGNGIFIHQHLIPKLKSCIGKKIMDYLKLRQLRLIFTTGAVSMVGWAIPFVCGTVPELNYDYPFTSLILAFLIVLLASIILANGVLWLIYKRHHKCQSKMKIEGADVFISKQ